MEFAHVAVLPGISKAPLDHLAPQLSGLYGRRLVESATGFPSGLRAGCVVAR
jgi:hypothetical protein